MSIDLDILAFAPHPDDAEIGCAGALALATRSGRRAAIADMTAGEMSSRGDAETRKREANEAAQILKLHERYGLGLPDTRIGTDESHRYAVVELIRKTRPRVVLAPYGQDRHPDHRATSSLVREACFYAGIAKAGSGDPFRPSALHYYQIHTPFIPDFVVDISAVWMLKKRSIAAFASQFDSQETDSGTALSSGRFLRSHEAAAVTAGAMIGVDYGEIYCSAGPIAMQELPDGTAHDAETRLPHYNLFQ